MYKTKRPLPPYIFSRGSLLYFRYSIPKDLIPIVGKAELRYSLRTGYVYLAKQRTQRLVSSLSRFIKLLRNSVPMQELTEHQIQKLLNRHLAEALQESEQSRIASTKRPKLDDLEDTANSYSYVESDYREGLATHDYRRVYNSVDTLLEEQGFQVDKKSDSYKKLCREMMKINIRYLQTERKRLFGDYSGDLEGPISGNGGKPYQAGPKCSELFAKFVDEYIGSERWTEKTRAENGAVFDLFIEIIGDASISDFDYETALKYKETLRKIPANKNKKPEYRDKSIQEILAMENVVPMSISSVNKNLTRMNQFMKWVQKNGYVGMNVLEGLGLPEEKRKDKQRDIFTNSDLQKIFNNEIFTKREYLHSYMFWLPLIGLYTGARLEELCSLHLEDFQVIDGIDVININKDQVDKKLKTKAGERTIPIHPDLIKIGLIKHVAKLKKNGEERLFPELNRERDGYGQGPSKWFGKFKSKLGFKKFTKTFHSFRHTFIDSLKQLDAPPILVKEVCGHDSDDVTFGRYGKSYKMDKVYDEVRKLNFGLDINKFK